MSLIRVIDFEGTGLDASARVIEYGWADLETETREILRHGSALYGVEHIPPETRAIHHIGIDQVRGLAPWDRRIIYEEAMRDGVAAFAAHNIDYEARFIMGSLPLLCTYKAALRRWPDAPGHSVFALLYWLEDQGRVEFEPALAHPPHRAGPDAYATAALLSSLIDEGVTGRDLRDWTGEPRLLPKCPIGKFRGQPWSEVDDGFLDWILSKHDMDPDIQWNARRVLDERYR